MGYIDYNGLNQDHVVKSKKKARKSLHAKGRGKGGCYAAPPLPKPEAWDGKISVAKKSIVYGSLKRTNYTDGMCRSCGHYPNSEARVLTDEGMKYLVVCTNCDYAMLPYRSS